MIEFRTHPELIPTAIDRLSEALSTLSAESRSDLVLKLLEAAETLAEQSPGREGFSSREPAEATIIDEFRVRFNLDAPKPLSPLSQADPVAWAARWTETMVDASFNLLSGMHEGHERERAAGHARLDAVSTLAEIPDLIDGPSCDQGVLWFPRAWKDRRFWLIGDLHGDIEALDRVLARVGATEHVFPGDSVLLFLGDYGDRGPGTLAVWLRLASLKQRFPLRVFLLRGNHEETVSMRLCRADNGTKLNTLWQVPSTSGMESYLMLAMAMHGNLNDVAMVYDNLADVALLPGGVIAVHGCLPPRWKPNDGWNGTEEQKKSLTVGSLRDLRKPSIRSTLRWTDFTNRSDVDGGWSDYQRGSRLYASSADLSHWRQLLGQFVLVHGHTHPSEGYSWEDEGHSLALNTSIHTSRKLAIASLDCGKLSAISLS